MSRLSQRLEDEGGVASVRLWANRLHSGAQWVRLLLCVLMAQQVIDPQFHWLHFSPALFPFFGPLSILAVLSTCLFSRHFSSRLSIAVCAHSFHFGFVIFYLIRGAKHTHTHTELPDLPSTPHPFLALFYETVVSGFVLFFFLLAQMVSESLGNEK